MHLWCSEPVGSQASVTALAENIGTVAGVYRLGLRLTPRGQSIAETQETPPRLSVLLLLLLLLRRRSRRKKDGVCVGVGGFFFSLVVLVLLFWFTCAVFRFVHPVVKLETIGSIRSFPPPPPFFSFAGYRDAEVRLDAGADTEGAGAGGGDAQEGGPRVHNKARRHLPGERCGRRVSFYHMSALFVSLVGSNCCAVVWGSKKTYLVVKGEGWECRRTA